MKNEDARVEIVGEFRRWWADREADQGQATGNDGMVFLGYLRKEKPHLLDFKASGDKWQIVHGWLLRADLVSD